MECKTVGDSRGDCLCKFRRAIKDEEGTVMISILLVSSRDN